MYLGTKCPLKGFEKLFGENGSNISTYLVYVLIGTHVLSMLNKNWWNLLIRHTETFNSWNSNNAGGEATFLTF